MKSIVSFTHRNNSLVVTTKKYSLFSQAKAYKFIANKATLELDGRQYRIAYDGSILFNLKGNWREVV